VDKLLDRKYKGNALYANNLVMDGCIWSGAMFCDDCLYHFQVHCLLWSQTLRYGSCTLSWMAATISLIRFLNLILRISCQRFQCMQF